MTHRSACKPSVACPQFLPDLVGASDHGWSGSVFRSLVRVSVNWVRQLLWTMGAIDPPLRSSQPLQLCLLQGGNPLFIGGIELGIGSLVILKRTDVHVGLCHRRSTILFGLNGSGC